MMPIFCPECNAKFVPEGDGICPYCLGKGPESKKESKPKTRTKSL